MLPLSSHSSKIEFTSSARYTYSTVQWSASASTYVEAEADHCTVEYVYRAEEVNSIFDECELSGSIIPERVIAEGVISESLINAGMYQEALLWRDRYEKSVKNCLLKRKVEKIKTRIWF